jgi:hypothetical protein
MCKLVPFSVTAQVIAVLPLKKFAVNTEENTQKPAADWERINIILLKKTQIHASYGCPRLPVSSYGSHNGPHPVKSNAGDGYSEKAFCRVWGSPEPTQAYKSLCFLLLIYSDIMILTECLEMFATCFFKFSILMFTGKATMPRLASVFWLESGYLSTSNILDIEISVSEINNRISK